MDAPSGIRFDTYFLHAGPRVLHCARFRPAGHATRGHLLFVQPFAEELNKCRRMLALQARACAGRGWEALIVDLTGTGDSAGDFGEASWPVWLDDLDAVLGSLKGQGGVWLVGVRAGALLAAAIGARRPEAVAGLMLWQPVASGRTYLQQFLRLKVAGERLSGALAPGATDWLAALDRGEPVEVAGYTIAPDLAAGLQQAGLDCGVPRRVGWFEVSARGEGALAPAAERCVSRWREAGCEVRVTSVTGPQFWQTQEIELAPALIAASTDYLDDMHALV